VVYSDTRVYTSRAASYRLIRHADHMPQQGCNHWQRKCHCWLWKRFQFYEHW